MPETSPAATAAEPASREREIDALAQRFADIAERLPGGAAFVVDRGLRYRLASGDALRAAGLAPSDLLGRTVAEVVPARDRDAYLRHYEVAFDGGTFVHEHVAHGRRYVSRGVPLRAADGEIVAALALSFDITGTTGIEAQVRDRDAALEAALDVAGLQRWDLLIDTDEILAHGASHGVFGRDGLERLPIETVLDVVHDDDVARVRAALRACAAGRGDFRETYRVRGPDGRLRWRRSAARLVRASRDGAWPARLVGVLADVTELVEVRERLAGSERRLAAELAELERLYATSPVGLAVFDRETRYRRINRWLADINGASVEAHLGRTVREMVPELGEQAAAVIGRVLETGEALLDVEFVGATLRQPGETRTFVSHWHPLRDGGDATIGVGAVVQDVTELRALQSRLRRREAEMARVADNAPVVLGRVDAALRHLSVNRAATGINGRLPEHFVGRTSRELGMPEPAVSGWEASMRATFADGEARQMMLEVSSGAGATRWFEARLVPERGEDGAIESVLYVAYDVTERQRAEAALRDADARKDEFLAMLAHELRNPLAPLRNSLRALERDALSPQGRVALQVCGRQLHQLTRLVDDLLEVSRVTRGKIALRIERVMLQQVVYTVADGLAPQIEERGQSLAFDIPGAPVWIEADGVRIAQILENLMSNASKYTDAGGRIAVSVEPGEDAVTVSVRDTGIGIAPEYLPRVFELFTQVDTAIDRSRGGLGIGLALVRRLVELHGGTVEAASDGPGRGSTFTVVLPRRAPAGAGGPEETG